ncbi:MAG: hypothetical protein WAT12_15115 [Candidatus Nitrotoga sp.]
MPTGCIGSIAEVQLAEIIARKRQLKNLSGYAGSRCAAPFRAKVASWAIYEAAMVEC